jgi:hypothetical protein
MTTFRPNAAFPTEVRAMPGVRALRIEKAKDVKARAQAIAPHGPTGMYRRLLDTYESLGMIGVTSKDFAGHMVEWGSQNNPIYAPIRRAVLAAGLTLRELPKS